ncbi:MAG TPA: two-component system response regulator [Cytophagales bacterium]|nr:two-component system response regulator [Cytophagales bacterium]HAA21134.1 two-component system response regulator [Cytophagales bacterium]HAP61127.1 two-component system response regulator [Cytophagales bacterium]
MKELVIVDDNPMMRAFLYRLFSNSYNVTVYPDGLEALQYLEEGHTPDLIISDFKMPYLDGKEFLMLIQEQFKHIPVIFLSGDNKGPDRIHCLSQGAQDFIMKPFNPKELKLKVKHLLDTKYEIKVTSQNPAAHGV